MAACSGKCSYMFAVCVDGCSSQSRHGNNINTTVKVNRTVKSARVSFWDHNLGRSMDGKHSYSCCQWDCAFVQRTGGLLVSVHGYYTYTVDLVQSGERQDT